MTKVHDERTKLLAGALDRASTACFTVGIATPVAGCLYDVSGFRSTIGLAGSGLRHGGLADRGRRVTSHREAHPREAHTMNEYFVLAFVITPAIVVALG